jgi:SSS family transporter
MNLICDLIIILFYFALIVSVGLWCGRDNQSIENLSVGGRKIPWWAVLASLIAAEVSAATFLGAPGEGFELRNFTYAQLALGIVMGRIVVSYVFIKPYYDYRVISIYEFLQIRFGVKTRNTASLIFLFTRVLASGTRLYIAAVILVLGVELVTGTKSTLLQEFVIYISALTVITLITCLYTAVGGIKAVVWTDVIQAALMFGSILAAICMLFSRIDGGWPGVVKTLGQPHDLAVFDFGISALRSWDENLRYVLGNSYTLWAAFFGATFVTMATHGTDQDMVQRMLTAKNHHRSRLAVIASGLADIPVVVSFLLVGILLCVFYQQHPDPNLPDKNPYVFAYYILHELPVGMRGILVAGLFATTMGSLSTALNALSTSFIQDWYLPYFNRNPQERAKVRAMRWATCCFAVALIVVGALTAWVVLTVPKSRIIPIVLGVFGYTYGPLLGVFLVGMLTKRRGAELGNIVAMISGLAVVSFFSGLYTHLPLLVGKAAWPSPAWLPPLAFPWWITLGTLVTLTVSLWWRTPETQVAAANEHKNS